MNRWSLDMATLVGMGVSFALLGVALFLSGSLHSFIDLPSFLLVMVGTFFVTMTCFSLSEIFTAQSAILRTFFHRIEEPSYAAFRAVQMAEHAKKNGVLALQGKEAMTAHNRFFSRGIQMVIDNYKTEDIENTLEQALVASSDRHRKGALVLRKSSEIAPAMGLIGTLIGLVQMLSHLNDPAAIGPGMALALLTTLYGAVLAYMVFTPLAAKLEHNSQKEMVVSTIYKDAICSISRKESPRQLETHLNTTLPKDQRIRFYRG